MLKSEEFLFREWPLQDEDSLLTILGNPLVTKNLWASGAPLNNKSLQQSLQFFVNQYRQNGYGPWAVHYKNTNQLIGICGFKRIPELVHPDLGFALVLEQWGKGIATKLCTIFQRFCLSRTQRK